MIDRTWQERMREAIGVVRVPRDVKRKRARAKANKRGVRRPVQTDHVPVLEPSPAKVSRMRIEARKTKPGQDELTRARRKRSKEARRANR